MVDKLYSQTLAFPMVLATLAIGGAYIFRLGASGRGGVDPALFETKI